jgi:hypothetical protein
MCGGSTGGSAAPACVPGQSIACVGPNGCSSNQLCNDQGSSYGPCLCVSESGDAQVVESGGQDAIAEGHPVVDASNEANPIADAVAEDVTSTDAAGGDASACNGSPPTANATYLSDPATMQSSSATEVILHKDLSAYANYGTSGADILYTGQVGAWSFSVPAVTVKSATAVASLVADDGGTYPGADYAYSFWAGACDFTFTPQLPHGSPFDSHFTNWVTVSYPAVLSPAGGGTFTMTIQNTSALPSTAWIAVQWVELRITTQ